MNFLKGYKTVIFNSATALAALAQYADLVQVVAPEYVPLVLLVVGIANLVLRYLTTTPIGVATTQ
jgi:hypothetical protein